MKSTGIIRRVDELGRVVIPIEIRNQFNIVEKDPIEIEKLQKKGNEALETLTGMSKWDKDISHLFYRKNEFDEEKKS